MQRQAPTKIQQASPKANRLQAQSARTSSAGNSLLKLQGPIGNHAVQRLITSPYIQTKLKVSTPGDPFEREADHVADTVMRMADPVENGSKVPTIQSRTAASQIKPKSKSRIPVAVREDDEEEEEQRLQRVCDDCEEEMAQEKGVSGQSQLSRKVEGVPQSPVAVSTNINAMQGSGTPLSAATRTFFEPRFGADFSRVRVHTDARANDTAKSINAKAFTTANDIVFGSGQYKPESIEGQHLLAHELTHVIQQDGGQLLPEIQRRIDPTAMTVTADVAAGLGDDDLRLAIDDVRTYLNNTPTGDPLYDAAAGNLQVLETEQGNRLQSFAPVDMVDAAPPPAFSEPSGPNLPGDTTSGPVCEGPAPAPAPRAEDQVCHGPIAASGLTRDQVLADYRTNARKLLTFFLDASRVWADTVVRQQLTTDTGAVSEQAVVDLRAQGNTANELARAAFDKKQILIAIDYLIEYKVPPEGSPVPEIAARSTIGSIEFIRNGFTRSALDRMGYPPEIPDIVQMLQQLGLRASVTDAEVEGYILQHATEDQLWNAGIDHLQATGAVTWFPNAEPEFDWRDRVYTDDEIIAVGVGYILDDENLRFNARSLLELARGAEPLDPDIEAVLDRESEDPSFNYVALRFVTARIRDAAASEHGIAQQALEKHLSQYPILRMFVDNEAVLMNYLSTDTFMHAIEFHPIIDVEAISTTSVLPKLDQLLTEISELQQKIASDDDFLFDSAIAQSVAPLIQLYREADSTYADWIDAAFQSNRKWEEAMSGLLTLAALLGFVVGSALSAGAAAPFLIAGVIASIGLAIRSQARADVTGAVAHTGLGSREMAAVSYYQAWLDTAMAALGVLQVLTRGVGAAARMLAASEEQAIANTLQINIARVYQAANLTTAEMAQIAEWQGELEQILRRAVQIVDSGQGQTRWSQFMRSGHPRAGLAVTRGNAIHSEAFELIDQGEHSLPTSMSRNQGVALPARGLPNRYPGRLPTSTTPMRPDVRIALPGGREAVFDFTSTAQLGHSAAYGNQAWVASVIELGY